MMADPNGMGTGLGAEHGQHQQGGSSGTLAQQPVQGVLPMHQGIAYPPGPSGMPAGVPSGMYQPAPYMPMPQQQQNEQLRLFWLQQNQEIQQVGTDPAEFKNHQLPLARIKKIMKSDEDVRMISAEAPVLFAKACEMFILELTLRSWNHSEENKRRTLQRNDIAAAITRTDIFDFLVDIVPREERCDEGPRPQPMPSMPVPGMGYWQQQQQPPPQQQQQQQPPMQAGPGDQHMGLPQQRQPSMQMDPAMMQAYYMQQQQVAAAQQQQHNMQHQQQQLQFQHQQQQGVPQASFDHHDGQPNGE